MAGPLRGDASMARHGGEDDAGTRSCMSSLINPVRSSGSMARLHAPAGYLNPCVAGALGGWLRDLVHFVPFFCDRSIAAPFVGGSLIGHEAALKRSALRRHQQPAVVRCHSQPGGRVRVHVISGAHNRLTGLRTDVVRCARASRACELVGSRPSGGRVNRNLTASVRHYPDLVACSRGIRTLPGLVRDILLIIGMSSNLKLCRKRDL